MNLTEFRKLVGPKVIAANWTEAASNRVPYLGEMLFPAQKKAGLDLSWIKGHKGLPVSLMPSTFDAKATFRDRPGVQLLETEMPFFREGFKIKEKDRQDILRIQEKGDPYMVNALNRVFDDAANLIEGALVACERERMQLLFPVDGEVGIQIKANGVDYTYEYDANDVWKGTNYFALTSTAAWDQTSTADPFANIQTAKDCFVVESAVINDIRCMIEQDQLEDGMYSAYGVAYSLQASGTMIYCTIDSSLVNALEITYDPETGALFDYQSIRSVIVE